MEILVVCKASFIFENFSEHNVSMWFPNTELLYLCSHGTPIISNCESLCGIRIIRFLVVLETQNMLGRFGFTWGCYVKNWNNGHCFRRSYVRRTIYYVKIIVIYILSYYISLILENIVDSELFGNFEFASVAFMIDNEIFYIATRNLRTSLKNDKHP